MMMIHHDDNAMYTCFNGILTLNYKYFAFPLQDASTQRKVNQRRQNVTRVDMPRIETAHASASVVPGRYQIRNKFAHVGFLIFPCYLYVF